MARKTTASISRADAVLSLIGNTPAVPLRFEPEGLTVHVKCEFVNPSGSIKDRLAKCVILTQRAGASCAPTRYPRR